MITLECNYTKKIGLPGYSSHQFSITLRTEITDVSHVQPESSRLYNLLQQGVDSSMKQVGYLPGQTGGSPNNGTSHPNPCIAPRNADVWACSPKQKGLILDIIRDNQLDHQVIEALSRERFNAPVKTLNKMQASNLIDELLGKYGKSKASNGNGGNGFASRRYAKTGGQA